MNSNGFSLPKHVKTNKIHESYGLQTIPYMSGIHGFCWFLHGLVKVKVTKPCKNLCIENNLTTIGSWILLVFQCFGNEKPLEFMDFIFLFFFYMVLWDACYHTM